MMLVLFEWIMNDSDARVVLLLSRTVLQSRISGQIRLRCYKRTGIHGADEDLGHEARRYATFQRPCATKSTVPIPAVFACECYIVST